MGMHYRLFNKDAFQEPKMPFAIGISEFPLVVGDLIKTESGSTYRVEERRMKHEDMPPKGQGPWSAYLSITWADLYVVRFSP